MKTNGPLGKTEPEKILIANASRDVTPPIIPPPLPFTSIEELTARYEAETVVLREILARSMENCSKAIPGAHWGN